MKRLSLPSTGSPLVDYLLFCVAVLCAGAVLAGLLPQPPPERRTALMEPQVTLPAPPAPPRPAVTRAAPPAPVRTPPREDARQVDFL